MIGLIVSDDRTCKDIGRRFRRRRLGLHEAVENVRSRSTTEDPNVG
jgi:hypothetical protein